MLEIPEGLEKKYKKAASLLEKHDKFRIITHYDADGITAAAVLSRAFMKEQKGFHTTFVHKIPEEIEDNLPIIFSDVGNSQLERIVDLKNDVIVLDHHKVPDPQNYDTQGKVFINPHDYGIDGAQEVSGGTLAFLLAVFFDEKNWKKAVYGLAGAAADKQNIGGFKGLNKKILSEALERNVLEVKNGLLIDGDGIKDALLKACDPYFPGISGRVRVIDNILDKIGMDPETPVDEIPMDKERKLNSLLILSLFEKNIPSHVVESVRSERYVAGREKLDVDFLYKLLNACSRVDKPGIGLSLCLGDDKIFQEAVDMRDEYRSKMVERLIELEDEGIEQMKNIQYFYEERKTRKGELAGLGMLYFLDQDKPTFGLTENGDDVDISCRATKRLVEAGLDLGKLSRKLALSSGGSGGGHDIAAGATVPKNKIDDFLDEMDKEVGKNLRDT